MVNPQTPEAEVGGWGPGGLGYTSLFNDIAIRTDTLTVRGRLADESQQRRLAVWVGTSFSPGKFQTFYGPWTTGSANFQVVIPAKKYPQETLLKIKVFAQNPAGQTSAGVYGTVWTNRKPTPTIVSPASGISFDEDTPLTIDWQFEDPDADDTQTAYIVYYRRAAYGDVGPGPTTQVSGGTNTSHVISGGTFDPFVYYEWSLRVCDGYAWSLPSDWSLFYVTGSSSPPLPLAPAGESSVVFNETTEFRWKFRDVDRTATQVSASIRYRAVGSDLWTTIVGDPITPGSSTSWDIAANTFTPGVEYEWQVQTDSSVSDVSNWSISAYFWCVPQADVNEDGIPELMQEQGELGCGTYRVFVYDRGGQTLRGEITPLVSLQWDRRRDDISQALFRTNGFDEDCGELLRGVHCWMHEVVIFRDGVRVWEGPIVRITESVDGVEIEARDVMVYVYRRILRQGYNDSYPRLRTVVYRATRIIQDALGYDDPNVLAYLSPLIFPDDAQESRVVQGWTKTAWEEVDDLAANAGLDYTAVGRRILLWDVHRPVGTLPEMRNGDFSDPVKVTEYGMQTANLFAVTNNAGVYGYTQTSTFSPYGHIEQIASAYGENQGSTTAVALTPTAKAALEKSLQGQAKRNISNRYPTPVVVRVPDNTTVMPTVGVGINQLVPGVHIPLRAVGVLREVTQVQKLDNLTVTYTADEQEKVKVTMSPAPSDSVDTEPEVVPDV